MRILVAKIILHLTVTVLMFGFWLPFSISHKSLEIPALGFISLAVYVIYYFPIIYKQIKKVIK